MFSKYEADTVLLPELQQLKEVQRSANLLFV